MHIGIRRFWTTCNVWYREDFCIEELWLKVVSLYYIFFALLTYTTLWVSCIVYEHWPETREFITQTIELWNRWIRLSCYYNRV